MEKSKTPKLFDMYSTNGNGNAENRVTLAEFLWNCQRNSWNSKPRILNDNLRSDSSLIQIFAQY